LLEILDAAGVPCSPVRAIDDVMRWEQLRERGMITPLRNPLAQADVAAAGPGFPVKFGGTPAGYDRAAPIPGEHTDEVLRRLAGLDEAGVQRLRDRGVA